MQCIHGHCPPVTQSHVRVYVFMTDLCRAQFVIRFLHETIISYYFHLISVYNALSFEQVYLLYVKLLYSSSSSSFQCSWDLLHEHFSRQENYDKDPLAVHKRVRSFPNAIYQGTSLDESRVDLVVLKPVSS